MVERARRHKKGPPLLLLAQLSQPLQVKHLANEDAPSSQQVVVHAPVVVAVRADLEIDTAPATATTWLSHKKPGNGLALDQAAVRVLVCLGGFTVLLLFVQSQSLPCLGEAHAQKENVTGLEINVAPLAISSTSSKVTAVPSIPLATLPLRST